MPLPCKRSHLGALPAAICGLGGTSPPSPAYADSLPRKNSRTNPRVEAGACESGRARAELLARAPGAANYWNVIEIASEKLEVETTKKSRYQHWKL